MSILKFDPATGWECEPITAAAYRVKHGQIAWLFNPYTGNRRDPRDVGSDVYGHLIEPSHCSDERPCTPCFTDKGPCEEKPAACQGANCGCTDGVSHSPECIVETAETQGWANDPEAVEARYRAMVNRFLGWKLPADFYPDCYVSFDREKAAANNGWPVGTNLFHAGQALEMFKHCVELPAGPAATDIIRFTNGDDGVFAHVTAPSGKQYGINLEHMACDADDEWNLAGKFFRAVIDRVKAGALPSGAVLHTPSGAVFDEVIAAAEPADLVALTPQEAEHQCCGKCQGEAEVQKVEQELDAVMQRAYEQTIGQLSSDLYAAQHLLTIAMTKLGGVMDVSPDDYLNAEKAGALQSSVDPSNNHYVLRLVEQHQTQQ